MKEDSEKGSPMRPLNGDYLGSGEGTREPSPCPFPDFSVSAFLCGLDFEPEILKVECISIIVGMQPRISKILQIMGHQINAGDHGYVGIILGDRKDISLDLTQRTHSARPYVLISPQIGEIANTCARG